MAEKPAHGDAQKLERFCRNIELVILGKPEVIRLATVGLLAGGHVLVEDVPGVGKSTLARAIAKSLSCSFRRIQFTPDLLPSDITGVSVYNSQSNEFEFKPGPVFAHVLLADEINRTTPRTQSALLEAMNVGQVTVDGRTYALPRPFMVIATQNPIEYTGTYPLPESQLDRFALRLRVDYPDRAHERQMIANRRLADPIDSLQAVLTADEALQLAEAVKRVRVEEPVVDYLQDIIEATRTHQHLAVGASPRAALSLYRLAQALAFLERREFVLPDDVKRLAVPGLAHRVVAREEARSPAAVSAGAEIIREIVGRVPVPV
jgi:MoxR-like ATPase